MRFATIAVIAGLSALASAQSLDALPKCAQKCYEQNTGDCSPLDIKCICGTKELIQGLSCCVKQTCGEAETKTTIEFAAKLCNANGVEVPTSASCPASLASSTTAAPSSSSSASADDQSTTSTIPSGVFRGPPANETTSGTESSGASGQPTAASSTSTGGAAYQTGLSFGVAVAGLLAAL